MNSRIRAGCLFFESSSRSVLLFEHDLRANAFGVCREGKRYTLFRIVLQRIFQFRGLILRDARKSALLNPSSRIGGF
jgi:hypothetical protein